MRRLTLFDRDTWQEIFGTIRKHKLRTGLTALGVFWGIFMLIFVLGMGAGLKNGVYRQFGDRAKNVLFVYPNRTTMPYEGFRSGRVPRMTRADIDILKNNIDNIDGIAPRLSLNNRVARVSDKTEEVEIRGEYEDMIRLEALKVYEGRYINRADREQSRKVAVIGDRTRELLFGDRSGIGEYVMLDGMAFRVVGIFGPEQIKPWTESDLEAIVIPLTTMYRAFGTGERVDYFVCSAAPQVRVSEVEEKVIKLLKERHHIAPEDTRGIGSSNLEEEFQSIQNLFGGITAFLWFVGIGTLLAGIVGVSNIMLIVVKERTREIGLRKAMGATPQSIISMILIESIFITSISGYLGLLLSTLIVGGIDALLVSQGADFENFHHPEVDLEVGIGAVVLLVLAGTIAGLIPALQAARVNPVQALKDE